MAIPALETNKLTNIKTKKIKKQKNLNGDDTRYWIFSFVQQMRMRKCHIFCASMHHHIPYGTQQDFSNGSELERSAALRAHAQLSSRQLTEMHLNLPHAGNN